jgi:hypothetical protein
VGKNISYFGDASQSRILIVVIHQKQIPKMDFGGKIAKGPTRVKYQLLDTTLSEPQHERLEMRRNVAWPVTNRRIRASNPLRVTGPTFGPKPRRIARMLNSTSISRDKVSVRFFNKPWRRERRGNAFKKESGGRALAYDYFENEPRRRSAAKLLTQDSARRISGTFHLSPYQAAERRNVCV